MPLCLCCYSEISAGSVCSTCGAANPMKQSADTARAVLTAKGFSALEALLAGTTRLHPIVLWAIRRKLEQAVVVLPSDVPSGTATLNSRVLYQIDENAPETRTLVLTEEAYRPGHSVLVATPAGISLLGTSEGDETDLPSSGGRTQRLRLHRVQYQPERAHRRFFRGGSEARMSERQPSRLTGDAVLTFSRRPPPSPYAPAPEGDDPGPTAA